MNKAAEFWGSTGRPLDSVKRIDVFSTVITNKMSVNDVFKLDLVTPPFSPVFDPAIHAARIGRKYLL